MKREDFIDTVGRYVPGLGCAFLLLVGCGAAIVYEIMVAR